MMLQQRSTWSHSVPDTEKVGKDNPSAVAILAENLSPWPVHSIGGYHCVALLLVLVQHFRKFDGVQEKNSCPEHLVRHSENLTSLTKILRTEKNPIPSNALENDELDTIQSAR